MELRDYYYKETTIGTLGYNLGRGARAIRGVIPEIISPLKASVGVGVVWGGIAWLVSAKKCKEGKMSKQDAVLTTAGESAGMGLAAGIGILASNLVRASIVMTATTSLAPFVAGVVVTTGAKVLWDKTIKKHI